MDQKNSTVAATVAAYSPIPGAATLITVHSICITLAFICLVLRMYSRKYVVALGVGLEDWLICCAWVLSFGFSFFLCLATRHGLGLPLNEIDPTWAGRISRMRYASSIFYNPVLTTAKSSIVIFYLRLSIRKSFTTICYVIIAFSCVAGTILTFLVIFQCNPINAAYDIDEKSAKCINLTALIWASACNNVITDFAILIFPMPIMWKLRLPLRQRLGIMGIFALGSLVCAISLVRMHSILYIMPNNKATQSGLWTALEIRTNSNILVGVELNTAIIVANLPSVKPLLIRWFSSPVTSNSSNHRAQASDGWETTYGMSNVYPLVSFSPISKKLRINLNPSKNDFRTRGVETREACLSDMAAPNFLSNGSEEAIITENYPDLESGRQGGGGVSDVHCETNEAITAASPDPEIGSSCNENDAAVEELTSDFYLMPARTEMLENVDYDAEVDKIN